MINHFKQIENPVTRFSIGLVLDVTAYTCGKHAAQLQDDVFFYVSEWLCTVQTEIRPGSSAWHRNFQDTQSADSNK